MDFAHLPSMVNAFEMLRKLPGISHRNLYKLLMYLGEAETDFCVALAQAILSMKKNLKKCSLCNAWTEGAGDLCLICSDQTRNQALICVVETWVDYLFLSQMSFYNGVFHILEGKISPLDGMTPESLSIEPLIERVIGKKACEVVFSLSVTPEGEVTTNYICQKFSILGQQDLVCSRLATGVPFGSTLEFLDQQTLDRAFSGRQPIL